MGRKVQDSHDIDRLVELLDSAVSDLEMTILMVRRRQIELKEAIHGNRTDDTESV